LSPVPWSLSGSEFLGLEVRAFLQPGPSLPMQQKFVPTQRSLFDATAAPGAVR
jgi:hypothetical protein